jgi:hypothetical protein
MIQTGVDRLEARVEEINGWQKGRRRYVTAKLKEKQATRLQTER